MWSVVVVIDQVLQELVFELLDRVKGGFVQEVFLKSPPEALHLAIGLRTIWASVAMSDAEFREHSLKGM